MRPRLFTLAAAVSAVLCAGACGLWVRGYRMTDELRWVRVENAGRDHYLWYFSLLSGRGGLAIQLDAEVYDRDSITDREAARPVGRWARLPSPRRRPQYPQPWSPRTATRWGGFAVMWQSSAGGVVRDLVVPAWAVVVATAALPAI